MGKIYLAGKVSKNDWRHEHVRPSPGRSENGALEPWPTGHRVGEWEYTGPFFVSDDHGCAHGPTSHGAGIGGFCGGGYLGPDRPDVLARCLEAIRRADIVFAWLDDETAYGTIAEIGYAKGLGKFIIVASPHVDTELWFPEHMASLRLFADSPKQALSHLTALRGQVA